MSTTRRKRGRPPVAKTDGRDDIKKAALSEFAKRGFKGASIDQIAKTAGVAKPLIHYHFASKDELWKLTVKEAYDLFQAEALKLATQLSQQPPEEILGSFGRIVVRFAADRADLVQITINETRQGGERADWLMETYLVPMYRAVLGVLEHVQDSEGSQRRFGSHMIPSMFGALIFPFIDSGAVSEAFKTDVFSEDYIAEQADYVEMLMRASMQAGSSK